MQWIYFDASALVKRYVPEEGTDIVNEVFQCVPHQRMACSRLGILELVSIIQRKHNAGRINPTLYQQAFVELNAEVLQADSIVITSVNKFDLAGTVAFIVAHNINATDAIILRSAIDLQQVLRSGNDDVELCTSDQRLVRAARAEGLPAVDPEVAVLDEVRKLLNIPADAS